MRSLITQLRAVERREAQLCEREEWTAAEACNAEKLALIRRLKDLLAPAQVQQLEMLEARAFLRWLAAGSEGPYPSVADAIEGILTAVRAS